MSLHTPEIPTLMKYRKVPAFSFFHVQVSIGIHDKMIGKRIEFRVVLRMIAQKVNSGSRCSDSPRYYQIGAIFLYIIFCSIFLYYSSLIFPWRQPSDSFSLISQILSYDITDVLYVQVSVDLWLFPLMSTIEI